MMTRNLNSERLLWLDWMKVLAIFSIIWGHFFSEGHLYLYVFNVQVFCVISGFLYKKASNWKTCVKKCFWQLFVPTVIMSIIMQLEAYLRCLAFGMTYDISWLWFFEWLLLGHRWCMGPCWYFYSLIIMRLIMQLRPEKNWMYFLLFLFLSCGAISYQYSGYAISNANLSVLVCMPFFLIGVYLKKIKQQLCNLHNCCFEVGLLICAFLLLMICGNYNGYVWMYLCDYGNNYALFIIGGMAGTCMLYVLSLWLSRLPYRKTIEALSKGSILIIGLHIIIVRRLIELPDRSLIEDLFLSLFILLCFVPLIRITELFFPILLGKHK